MNKISKKIVSLVTMAAFALTLVPATVFAATGDGTSLTLTPDSQNVVVDQDATITLNVGSNDANQAAVYVWVEEKRVPSLMRITLVQLVIITLLLVS